jgi:hypothetical protein
MNLPRLLLISGTGRNSGKTLLACRIIEKFGKTSTIIALKISSHWHKIAQDSKIITNEDNLYIAEETDAGTQKDSSRMLAAGAKRSFFIVAADKHLLTAMHHIIEITANDDLLICESGGIRNWVEPGLFLMVSRNEQTDLKPAARKLTDFKHTWIPFDGRDFSFDINRIKVHHNHWKTEPPHDIS